MFLLTRASYILTRTRTQKQRYKHTHTHTHSRNYKHTHIQDQYFECSFQHPCWRAELACATSHARATRAELCSTHTHKQSCTCHGAWETQNNVRIVCEYLLQRGGARRAARPGARAKRRGEDTGSKPIHPTASAAIKSIFGLCDLTVCLYFLLVAISFRCGRTDFKIPEAAMADRAVRPRLLGNTPSRGVSDTGALCANSFFTLRTS